MADPIDPNAAAQAVRGLRMPGVGGVAQNVAGSPVTGGIVKGATNAAGYVSNALGGLRDGAMNMLGRAAASPITGSVVRAATNAPGAIADAASSAAQGVAGSPITGKVVNGVVNAPGAAADAVQGMRQPGFLPGMIGKVQGAVSSAADAISSAASGAADKVASMRTPASFLEGDASIPTLTDVIHPGVGPHAPVPEIPTLTDVIQPGHPALQDMRAPTNPNFASGMSPERAAFNAEQGVRMGPMAPRASGPLPGSALESASEFLKPLNEAFGGAAKAGLRMAQPVLNVANKVGPYALPATTIASAAGSYGEDYDKRLGVQSDTPGMDLLHRGLGVMGDLGNTLTFGLADRVGNALAGGDFGHSDFGSNEQATPPKDIVGTHYGTPAAPTAPAAPATPDDIAEFNARMQTVGAPSISMRAGPNDSRVIGNDAPASKEAQQYTADHMADRTAQLTAADNGYREQAARQHAQTMLMQDPDVMRLTDELAQAQHGGSPAAIQAIANARDNMIRTKSGDRQTDTQANVAMRGQDVTDRDNARSTSATIMNGMRQAAIAQRQYGLEARKVGDDEAKTAQSERETAQKGLADQLGKMFTTKDDKGNAVPDAARVGDALQKVHEELGARIQDLQAVPKDSPHYGEAQSLITQLSSKGLAALDDDDRSKMMSQLAVRDRVKQTHGLMPGSSTFVDSRLGGYEAKGVDTNLIGSNTVNLRNGGNVRMNDLRYVDPANTIFPDFKQRTDQYNAGLGMRVK